LLPESNDANGYDVNLTVENALKATVTIVISWITGMIPIGSFAEVESPRLLSSYLKPFHA
jgi:hypothetical protein